MNYFRTLFISVFDVSGQITSSSSPPQGGENASESSDDVEILQVIPPEIRNRLSKNVTLTVEGANKPLKKKPNVSTNQTLSKSCKSEVEKQITVSQAVDKVLQKTGVELTLSVQPAKSGSKSSQQSKNTSNVGSDSSVTQQKPGPLSSKSPEKRKSDTILEESAKKRLSLSENQDHTTKYVKKVVVGHQSSLISTTTSLNDSTEVGKKNRGRPKKEIIANKEVREKYVNARGRPRKYPLKINSLPNSPSAQEMSSSYQKLDNYHSLMKENVTSPTNNSNNKVKHINSFEVNRKIVPFEKRRVEAATHLNGDVIPNSLLQNSKTPSTKNVNAIEGSSNVMKTNLTPQNNTQKNSTPAQNTKGTQIEDKPDEKQSKEEEKSEEEEEEYTCSACNVRFTSIYDHIKKYHNGEEVVVEVMCYYEIELF